ncbi:hypothetical protein [Cryptosporangium sp. NPDC051539]|uniref:hypothetical protein n=1 Tax=Cryptosporangium sp. NPDC051539 TaxID=3363962 RepID=UPI003789E4E1
MTLDPIRAAAEAVAELADVFAGPWRRGNRQMHTAWPDDEDTHQSGYHLVAEADEDRAEDMREAGR